MLDILVIDVVARHGAKRTAGVFRTWREAQQEEAVILALPSTDSTTIRPLAKGDTVDVRDIFSSIPRHVCRGFVERTTATQIIVRTQHGSQVRFRKADLRMVGFRWPHCTQTIAFVE